MSVIDEAQFWADPAGEDVVGHPPYDVVSVATRIITTIKPVRILDLGCGFGRLSNFIATIIEPHRTVHGVDISRSLLDRAVMEAPGNAYYWHGDGRRLPSGLGGKFSGAYSVTMLQHVPHEAKWGYLREVHDRLEPGGVFLFTIALGEIDTFLNHQIADVQQFGGELVQVYDHVSIDSTPDVNGWTWVTARKAAE